MVNRRLFPYTTCKVNSKWIIDLSVGVKTVKRVEKKTIWVNLCDFGLGIGFSDTPKAYVTFLFWDKLFSETDSLCKCFI